MLALLFIILSLELTPFEGPPRKCARPRGGRPARVYFGEFSLKFEPILVVGPFGGHPYFYETANPFEGHSTAS